MTGLELWLAGAAGVALWALILWRFVWRGARIEPEVGPWWVARNERELREARRRERRGPDRRPW